MSTAEPTASWKELAGELPSIQLDRLQLSDFELFVTGALAPQDRFRLVASQTWTPGPAIALRDPNNVPLAILDVESAAAGVYQGTIRLIEPPRHPDFRELRQTPEQVRKHLKGIGVERVISIALDEFPTEPTVQDLVARRRERDAAFLIHVIEHGAVDHFARIRAMQVVVERRLDAGASLVNLLPMARKDPELSARVQRNYGATEILTPLEGPWPAEIAGIVRQALPEKHEQGFCVWFTGLPSAGKSSIAEQVAVGLRRQGRAVTLLDGDVVRTHLSKGLGFSREDRNANIQRIGFVAAEVVRHRGVAICAAVSPYQESRDVARRMVEEVSARGNFILVHLATPPEVCQQRDVKGFYARARAGALAGMTGVDDPYEVPLNPEIRLETIGGSPESEAALVIEHLRHEGFLG